MSIWSDRIAKLKRAGISLADISRETQIPITTLYDLRRGDSKSPRYENAMKIEKFYLRALGKAA